ncbi:hypothetical protein PV327_011243, partial [Microctonus hyperodae]
MSINNKAILGGDINDKHQAWSNVKCSRSGKLLVNYLTGNTNRNCVIKYPNEPTFYSTNSINCSILDIYIVKNVQTSKPQTDWTKYRKTLNEDWTITKIFYNKGTINETIDKLVDTMKKSLKKATPKWKDSNCFNGMHVGIGELIIKLRNKVRKKYQNNRCEDCKKEYNMYNNPIKYELYKYRNKKYNEHLRNLKVSNGTLWNAVRINKLVNGSMNKTTNKLHGPN